MVGFDVAVCCLDERFTIRRCLTSVQAFAGYGRLIVVDDGSVDGTAEVARMFADVFLVSGERDLGVSRQLALDATEAEVLLFVDGDVELVRDVSPVVDGVDDVYKVVRGKNWQLVSGQFTLAHVWGVGMGLTAIDVEVARSVGGFPRVRDLVGDARGEDLAFCKRVYDAGYKCCQVGDRVYGVHYKSDFAVLPPRGEWPCEFFDEVVEAVAEADSDRLLHLLGPLDGFQVRRVVAEALQYGVYHQLRKRRQIVFD